MNLSRNDILEIAHVKSKDEAIEIIKSKIANKSIKSESDLYRLDIECGLAFELIKFGLEKGFTLQNEIPNFLSIQTNLIQVLKSEANLSLSQFTKILYDSLVNSADSLPHQSGSSEEKNLKEFIEFEVETILKSFNLLRYVFRIDRDSSVENERVKVYGPNPDEFDKLKMNEAKSYDQWLKEEKLNEIKVRENQLNERFINEEKSLANEEKQIRNLIDYINNDAYGHSQPLDETIIEKLINDISDPILDVTGRMLKLEVNHSKEKEKLKQEIEEHLKYDDLDPKAATQKVKSPKSSKNKKK